MPVYESSLGPNFHSSSDSDHHLTSNLNNGPSSDPCSNPSYQPSIDSSTSSVINVEYKHFHFTWILSNPSLEHMQRLLNVLINNTYPMSTKREFGLSTKEYGFHVMITLMGSILLFMWIVKRKTLFLGTMGIFDLQAFSLVNLDSMSIQRGVINLIKFTSNNQSKLHQLNQISRILTIRKGNINCTHLTVQIIYNENVWLIETYTTIQCHIAHTTIQYHTAYSNVQINQLVLHIYS